MKQKIEELLLESIQVKNRVMEEKLNIIAQIVDLMIEAFKNNNKVIFCGNGGSASDAQHLAAEFVNRFLMERRGLPALALHVNTSVVTAIGNDYGFDRVYARQVEVFGNPGDIIVGISTSGNSENIIQALRAARDKGLITIGLTGEGGGKLATYCDYLLDVRSNSTPRIQEAHITIGHILCQLVEEKLFRV